MPPPVEETSDEESGDIPFSTAPNVPEATDTNGKDEKKGDEDEDEEDEEDEDTYTIDKIVGHDFDEGDLKLHVKWEGYDDPLDLTREPEGNLLEDAPDILKEYFDSIGGRPEKPAKTGPKAGPGRKRKTTADSKSATSSATAANEPKRRRKPAKAGETPVETDVDEHSDNWLPKGKDWDKELKAVDTIMRDPESGGLFAFLLWNNGHKSRVSIETCYEKCPRKMLNFYERHLVFKDG